MLIYNNRLRHRPDRQKGKNIMKISDIIKELQERQEMYGDAEVIFRDCCGDDDIDILSLYTMTRIQIGQYFLMLLTLSQINRFSIIQPLLFD
jgi:hypothetical protein